MQERGQRKCTWLYHTSSVHHGMVLLLGWLCASPGVCVCVPPVLAAEGDIYRLPEHMRDAVEQQYRRDVQRVHGEDAGRFDDEYKSFIQVGGWWGVGDRQQQLTILLELFTLQVQLDFRLQPHWIASKTNVLADAASRRDWGTFAVALRAWVRKQGRTQQGVQPLQFMG